MESNAKIIIVSLNIFLLTIQTTHTALVTTSTVSPTISASNLSATTVPTTAVPSTISPDNLDLTTSSTTENSSEDDFIDPQTLEKLLHDDVEIEDLQHGGNFENVPKTINEDDEIIVPSIIENDANEPHWEAEWIEEDPQGKEEEEIPPYINVVAMDSRERVEYVFEGHIIGIVVAATLIILLVTGYVALISWRRLILNRYGSRQILVNEEDMVDPSDMKHFSL